MLCVQHLRPDVKGAESNYNEGSCPCERPHTNADSEPQPLAILTHWVATTLIFVLVPFWRG